MATRSRNQPCRMPRTRRDCSNRGALNSGGVARWSECRSRGRAGARRGSRPMRSLGQPATKASAEQMKTVTLWVGAASESSQWAWRDVDPYFRQPALLRLPGLKSIGRILRRMLLLRLVQASSLSATPKLPRSGRPGPSGAFRTSRSIELQPHRSFWLTTQVCPCSGWSNSVLSEYPCGSSDRIPSCRFHICCGNC